MISQEVKSALDVLHREIEKLEPAIEHVKAAQEVILIGKSIPQKHMELIQLMKSIDEQHKNDLQTLFENELAELTKENKTLQNTTHEIQEQLKQELESISTLKIDIQAFHNEIVNVNFPERLDKLDANVAGIMAAVQAVQSRLDLVEGNVKVRIKDLLEHEKGTRTKLTALINESKADILASIKSVLRRQQIFVAITWGLILVSIVLLFLILNINF